MGVNDLLNDGGIAGMIVVGGRFWLMIMRGMDYGVVGMMMNKMKRRSNNGKGGGNTSGMWKRTW